MIDEVGAAPLLAFIKINVLLANLGMMQSGFKGRQTQGSRGGPAEDTAAPEVIGT